MKNYSTFLNIVLTCVLAFVLFTAALPGNPARAAEPAPTAQPTQASEPVCNSSRSVSVSGTAVVNVRPDRTLIQLGVQSNGLTPESVQSANSAAIQKVIKSIKALGVDAKDIATDIYIIEPIYDDYSSLYIKGYRINNIVAVTLRDVNKTSSVIAAALKSGANQVINVEFYTSELRKYRDQARELAMQAAAEKAQTLARAAGADTSCVLNINENTWSYYNGWWYGGQSQNVWTQNVVQNAAPSGNTGSSGGDEPVSLGQISIRAEVGATFGLK